MNGRWMAVLAAVLCTGALLFATSAVAAEEETHTFDATLSLTGDCSISATVDPVPDPGLCPMPPGVPGVDHPAKRFTKHGGVAVDAYGNRYVASAGNFVPGTEYSEEARIDIFDASGEFITSIGPLTVGRWQMQLAVDSEGYLYLARGGAVVGGVAIHPLIRFKPTGTYNPAAGEIQYGEPPVEVPDSQPGSGGQWNTSYLLIAINPQDDHLLLTCDPKTITELGSAAEGNPLVENVTLDLFGGGSFALPFAIDGDRKRLYVADFKEEAAFGVPQVIKVFDLEAPHELLFTIDGATTPTKRFVSEARGLPIVIDQETGHIFVGDLAAQPTPRVYEFDTDGKPVSTIGGGRLDNAGLLLWQMAYDNGATSPTKGTLFVPSHNGPARSLAFKAKPPTKAPEVDELSVTGITASNAIMQGRVNPNLLSTSYRIEYITEQAFQEAGESFAGATLAGSGTLGESGEGLAVSAPVSGLAPGTAYRFRIFAENELGEGEADATFATYAAPEVATDCPNQALRTGPSAQLPDCRAYELVTPANTNGHPPLGVGGASNEFVSRGVSPNGNALVYKIEGGSLPGYEATGSFQGDPYLSTRTASGWSTAYVGPSPAFAPNILPGSPSPDQTYSFWAATGQEGPTLGFDTAFLHYPDGHDELLAQGSIGSGGYALGQHISEGGGHVIFSTGGNAGSQPPIRLEPDAAPDGTGAIYDRTADGALHVVSLKPGDEPFEAGERAKFQGASLNGVAVAFVVGDTLYLRHDNAETFALGDGLRFAGLAEDGSRAFYMEGGDLKAFDVATKAVIEFSSSGDVTPVIVSADGTAAYLLSPSVLTAEPSPSGDEAQAGAQNLYLSREGEIGFVGTVTERDVAGEAEHVNAEPVRDGLGLWTFAVAAQQLTKVPARASADGGTLLFKSRASLTGHETNDFAQIYRYDSEAGELRCLSCNPTGAASSSDATLQSEFQDDGARLRGGGAWLENLRADGRRAYFESEEGLVGGDVDGRRDVYQWEAEGVGSCARPGGCVNLISAGQSGRDDYLWAVSASGNDVFIRSSDLLGGGDTDETPSIYDARAGGGFAPPAVLAGECLGEACQPAARAPVDPPLAFEGAGNVVEAPARRPRCGKGRRAVKRAGKWRCVKRHKAKHHKKHKSADGNRRAGR